MEAVFSGGFMDGIAGQSESPVEEVNSAVTEWVVSVQDVAEVRQ